MMYKKMIGIIFFLSVLHTFATADEPCTDPTHCSDIAKDAAAENSEAADKLVFEKAIALQKNGQSKLAFALMEQLAKKDFPPAQYALGRMYSSGDGIDKNEEKALHWISSSAYYGYAEGQNSLALMYDEGWGGVRKSDTTAAHWYYQAANQGLTKAQVNIGLMFCLGEGTKQNMEQCAYWMKMAKEKGSKRAEDAWQRFDLDQYQNDKVIKQPLDD